MQYLFSQIFWYCLLIHIVLSSIQIIRWFISPIFLTAIGTVFFSIFYISGMVLSTSIVGYPSSVGTSVLLWLITILWFFFTLPHLVTIFLQFPEYLGLSLLYIFAALGTLPGLLPGPFSIYPGWVVIYAPIYIWEGLGYFLVYSVYPLPYILIWVVPASLSLAFFDPFFQAVIVLHLIYLIVNSVIKLVLCWIFPFIIPCIIVQICYSSQICIILRTILYYLLAIVAIIVSMISFLLTLVILIIVILATFFIPTSIILFCFIVTSPVYCLCTLYSILFICPAAICAIFLILIKDINLCILSGGIICCILLYIIICIIICIIITLPYCCICCCIISCYCHICCCIISCYCCTASLCFIYFSPLILSICIQMTNICLYFLSVACPCLIPFILCCISQVFLCLMPISTCVYCCSNILALCTMPYGLCCPLIYYITIPWIIISTFIYLCLTSNLFCYLCYILIYIFSFFCMFIICVCLSSPCICIECIYIICTTLVASCLILFCCIYGIILGLCSSCILCCLAALFTSLSTIVICLYFPPLMCCMYCCLTGIVYFIFYGLRCLAWFSPIFCASFAICAPITIPAQIIFVFYIYYPCLCFSQCCMLHVCLPAIITICCFDLIITNPCEIIAIISIYLLFASRIRFISGMWS